MTNLPGHPDTISLIGMPAAGKSTVGVLLAKRLGLAFRDTDLDIQVRAGATLQEILERDGHLALRKLEEQVLLEIPLQRSVISTGGSVVYSEPLMTRLAAAGPLVYLDADLATLERRVADAPPRGIASDSSNSFASIYAERTPLYRRYADHTVSACGASAEQVAQNILAELTSQR